MQLNLLLIRLYNFLKLKKVLFVYFPLAVYWIAIFIATSIPTDKIPQLFKFQDKFEHFVAYFILALLITFTIHFQEKYLSLKSKIILAPLLILIIYAGFDELHQMLIPGRVADVFDWTADVIGSTIGIFISNFIIRLASLKTNSN